jgi:hypothetical protein
MAQAYLRQAHIRSRRRREHLTMNLHKPALFAVSGALALGVAACGGDDSESSSSGSSGASSQQQNTPEPVAQIDTLTGRNTQVALDKGFVQALTDLKVAPAPVGSAKITKAGAAVFPITGGNVTYYEPGSVSPFVQGRVDHNGSGLSLTAGGTKVELQDFVVDPGTSTLTGSVSVDGEEAAASAPLFFLDGRTLDPLKTTNGGKQAVLEGTTVKLKKEAAALLNDTFKIDALKEGLVIGVAKITVNTGA